MLPFLVSRIGQGLIVMLLASLLIFSVLRLIPGDPAQVLAGRDATPEQVEQVRRQIGLDRPAWEQYATWLSGAVRGDFGRSFSRTVEVGTLLRAALLPSAELALAGFLFMVVVGVPLGIFAGLKPGGFPDYIATGFTMVTLGIPNFVFGLLLIWVLRGPLRPVPDHRAGRNQRESHRGAQVPRHADDRHRRRARGHPRPLRAQLAHGSAEPGLRADGAREGAARADGGAAPCDAQRVDPGDSPSSPWRSAG